MTMSQSSLLRSLLAMAGASFVLGAAAQTGAAVPASDRTFAEKAAAGGAAEVEGGKLAEQRAASDKVKQFGARMVQDHSKANEELKQLAAGKGLPLPSSPDAHSHEMMAKLQKLSGAEFDRAYMDHMVKDHKKDIAEFQKESNSGKDPQIKAFAAKTLPTLQEHLKMAEATHAEIRKAKP
jgi:putative membrane protein